MSSESSHNTEWPVRKENFGQLLRLHRRSLSLSQEQLGTAVGHDYTYISKLETGDIVPRDPNDILNLAIVLRLNPTEADELLHTVPHFATIRFAPNERLSERNEGTFEASWPNLLAAVIRVYAIERKESTDSVIAHLAVFAGVQVLIPYILAGPKEHIPRLNRLLIEIAARDIRTAALMVLRDVVVRPLKLDATQRKKQRLQLSLVLALAEIDAPEVDLAIRDIYSASLTASQRDTLRLFRAAVEKRIPGVLKIELPSL